MTATASPNPSRPPGPCCSANRTGSPPSSTARPVAVGVRRQPLDLRHELARQARPALVELDDGDGDRPVGRDLAAAGVRALDSRHVLERSDLAVQPFHAAADRWRLDPVGGLGDDRQPVTGLVGKACPEQVERLLRLRTRVAKVVDDVAAGHVGEQVRADEGDDPHHHDQAARPVATTGQVVEDHRTGRASMRANLGVGVIRSRRKPPAREKRLELGTAALAAPEHGEHQQVDQVDRRVGLADQPLDDQQRAVGGSRSVAVAKDAHRLLVVPVVEDGLEHVEVTAGGHLGEEVAGDHLRSRREPARGQGVATGCRRIGLVEQHAARIRVALEQPRQQVSATAADVDDASEPRHVVVGDDVEGVDHRQVAHRRIERRAFVLVIPEVVPDRAAERLLGAWAAGPHGLGQLLDGAPVRRPGERHGEVA